LRLGVFIFSFLFLPVLSFAQLDTFALKSYQERAEANLQIDLDSSLFYAQEILRVCEDTDHPQFHAFALNWSGLAFMNMGNPDSADNYFNQAIQYGNQNDQEKFSRLAKFNKSVNLLNKGDYEGAAESGLAILKEFQDINDSVHVAHVQYHIGSCYFSSGQYERAKKYFYDAIPVTKTFKSSIRLGNIYSALGSVYYMEGKMDSAILEMKKAIALKVAASGENSCGAQYLNVGDIYMSTGNYDSARFYFNKSLRTVNNLGDNQLAGVLFTEIASLFELEENYDSAVFYAYEALKMYDLTKDEYTHKLALYRLSNAYEAQEKFDSALYYDRKYNTLTDSLDNADVKARIAELDEKYQSAEKDKKITESKLLLREQKADIQNQIFVIIGLFVLLAGILAWFFVRRKQQRLKWQVDMIEERNRIAMDLHDHVGAELVLVSSKLDTRIFKTERESEKKDLEDISNQIKQVNATLRETVWSIQTEIITATELKEKVELLMYSMFQGMEMDFVTDEKCAKTLNPQQALTFYRISQEGISNIYKYANATTVEWHFTCTQNQMILRLKDNGIGFSPDEVSTGFGLGNMKARAEKIGATCNLKSEIGKGTLVEVVLG